MRDLSGAVALVTGGASGIGAAVCRRLSARGASVVVADIDVTVAEELAAEISGLAVRCDVTRPDDSVAAVASAEQAFGRLDVVHLNAGIGAGLVLDPLDVEAYRRVMAVNVDGVVFGLSAAVPALRRSGGGVVVATSSLSGLAAFPADALYAASKHAVVGLVRSAAESLAGDGIRIAALCPGFTDTPLVGPFVDSFRAAGFPMLTADDVAAALELVVDSDSTGEAWLVQPGLEPQPYRFRGVPGASTGSGSGQPLPDEVRTGSALG